jgi:hypothetical protein
MQINRRVKQAHTAFEEDFRLAEQLSTVTRWSQPDEFADILAEAA